MSIGIDTLDGIEHFRMCSIIGRLKIEISTGMTFRGVSTLKIVKDSYGFKGSRKKAALEFMENLFEERYGRKYGNTSN